MLIEVFYSKEISVEEPGIVLYLKGDKYIWSDYGDNDEWLLELDDHFDLSVRENLTYIKILEFTG